MDLEMRLHCPVCFNEEFEMPDNFNADNGYEGVKCSKCGEPITDEEVSQQGAEFAAKKIQDIINGKQSF